MHLRGQERRDRLGTGAEGGYAMAALLVALAVMALMMTVAMPVWNTAAKREREEELVWRGTQYARAVALFRRKYANASPPNLDILLNERFLRKKYKDPMTKDGEFQLVYATDQQQVPGQPTRPTPPPQQPPSPLDSQSRASAGARGGLVGVVSKSTDKSLRMFNGRTKYNEWSFTPDTVGLKMGGAGKAPGGAAGAVGPGGRPGPGGSMGSPRGLDQFGRPTMSPRPGAPGQPGPGQPGQPGQPPPRPFGLPPPRPPQ
jgi:type II secretory pathway pseudopilin PulG